MSQALSALSVTLGPVLLLVLPAVIMRLRGWGD